tara:strand:+ start:3130 stop:3417 length:288 start_codon:yes stop_codon:yes gene_type:complete
MEEGMVVDVLRESLSAYQDNDFKKAYKKLNKVHLEVYESASIIRDMAAVDAISVMAIIRVEFPKHIDNGSASWNKHYTNMLRAINELTEDFLNTI